MTRDMWHVTHNMWHMTCLGGVNILSKFQLPSSYRLWVMILWRYGGKGSVAEWISDEPVYRTAPATPGMLIISFEIRKLFMKPAFFRTFKQWQWTDENVQSYVDHCHYVFYTAQCKCLSTCTCTCPFTSTLLVWSLGLRSSSSLIISRLSQFIHDNTYSQHEGHDLWKVFLKSTGTPQPSSR